MSRTNLAFAATVALLAVSSAAEGAVVMSYSTTAPALDDAFDQFNMLDTATIPGGTTPGGGTYNSQAYSDNAGPPGQTFTTEGSFSLAQPVYRLLSISLKGANTGGGNLGGINASTTWGVRVSAVSGTTLTPIKSIIDIPSADGMLGNEWFTWTFSGADVPVLGPSQQYAFEVYSSAGYLGFDAEQGDGNYLQGSAFNSAGAARSFTDNTLGNLAIHGYDRTFVANLVPAVPEPTAAMMAVCGLLGTTAIRRRTQQ